MAGEHEPTSAWPTLTDARVAYTGQGWPSRLGMVAAGLGIAVLPSIAAAAPRDVVVIDVEDPAHRSRSAVALTPTEPTAAARAMVAALRTEAARIASSPPTADARVAQAATATATATATGRGA